MGVVGPPATPRAAGPREIALPQHLEERGTLAVVESTRDVPFTIERVYWISQVPAGARRGGHAHREVVEVLVAAEGSFSVVCDDGEETLEFALSATSGRALLVPPLVWRELAQFSPGAVCLVLASQPYAQDEYVCDRGEFGRLCASR
jgi:dTDP-4-dehydrorhamnose 3,5-epimerase-like enzyme